MKVDTTREAESASRWLGLLLFAIVTFSPLPSCVIERTVERVVIEAPAAPDASAPSDSDPKGDSMSTPIFQIGGHVIDVDAAIAAALANAGVGPSGLTVIAAGRLIGGMASTFNCTIDPVSTGVKTVTITENAGTDTNKIVASVSLQLAENDVADPYTISVESPAEASPDGPYTVRTFDEATPATKNFSIVFYKMP